MAHVPRLRGHRRRAGGGRRATRSAAGPVSASSAHSGSAGGPRCPQPRGQSSMASARSENASITSSGAMWARPNDRMPGVSTTQPRTVQRQRHRLGRRVPALADAGHHADGPIRCGHKAIHQRRLADAGVARAARSTCRRAASSTASRASSRPAVTTVRSRPANCAANGSGGARSDLVRHRIGVEPAGVGGDQGPLDEAGARRRVGQRDDDQQLVGVGDDHPLGRVGVIGGAAQHRSAFAATHDAGQGVGLAGQVADDVDLVADDDRRAAQFPGPHRGDDAVRVAAERAAPPAAVDGDDHGRLGVGVLGAGLGARTRTAARAHPDIGLVVLVRRSRCFGSPARPACPSHIRGKSGRVLAVVPMSSTSTPGTRSPTIAPAVAIRWSA